VFERLNSTYSVFWDLFPHLFEQVNSVFSKQVFDSILKMFVLFPLGEWFFVIREVIYAWPGGVVRSALSFEYFEYLVDFRVSLKEWFAVGHFDHDAPCRPNVDTEVITFFAHQDLRGAVPQGDNFMCQCLQWQFKTACETEITDLDIFSFMVYQNILWFKVTMYYTPLMAIYQW